MSKLSKPPENFEGLTRLIHERHDKMSKSYKRISLYLTQNPNDVAVKSLNTMAKESGAHASSFVRFAQSLGFEGFKDLQTLFQDRLTTAAPGFEARRLALEDDLGHDGANDDVSYLAKLVTRDIASLDELLNLTRQTDLDRAAELFDQAETVYIVGQLRSAPVAELFRYILTMLGKRTLLLDASGGLATHIAKTVSRNDVLLAISFRFYANEVVNIVEQAGSQGIPVVGVTDSSLSPIAKHANPLFVVPEREYTFSRSLAAPMCLAQAMMLSLAARQQDGEPRIPTATVRQ